MRWDIATLAQIVTFEHWRPESNKHRTGAEPEELLRRMKQQHHTVQAGLGCG